MRTSQEQSEHPRRDEMAFVTKSIVVWALEMNRVMRVVTTTSPGFCDGQSSQAPGSGSRYRQCEARLAGPRCPALG
jgi:hypothetical protein